MASTLTFTDGTTTVAISDAGAGLQDYAPKGARASDESVDEEATVNFLSKATAQTRINQINTIFARARMRATTSVGPRCFVQFAYEGEGTTWRSEITDGAIDVGDETLGVDPAANNLFATIRWTRAPYWEGAVMQLPISNQSASNNTGGLTINNHSVAGSASAYLTVAGSNILGDTPAPVRLELVNTTGSALGYLMYGLLNGTQAWNYNACLQCESSVSSFGQGGSGVNTASGSASNGTYLALSAIAGSAANNIRWQVANATLGLCDGKPVVPILRFDGTAPTLEYIRAYLGGLYTEYIQTVSTRKYAVLPPLPYPPRSLNGANNYATHDLYVYFWNPGGSADAMKPDHLTLIPAGDGWREINSLEGNSNISNGDTLIDDGIEQLTYSLTGGNRLTTYSAAGKWPLLIPGVDASFYTFCAENGVGNANPSFSWSAKLYYRPRRRSI